MDENDPLLQRIRALRGNRDSPAIPGLSPGQLVQIFVRMVQTPGGAGVDGFLDHVRSLDGWSRTPHCQHLIGLALQRRGDREAARTHLLAARALLAEAADPFLRALWDLPSAGLDALAEGVWTELLSVEFDLGNEEGATALGDRLARRYPRSFQLQLNRICMASVRRDAEGVRRAVGDLREHVPGWASAIDIRQCLLSDPELRYLREDAACAETWRQVRAALEAAAVEAAEGNS